MSFKFHGLSLADTDENYLVQLSNQNGTVLSVHLPKTQCDVLLLAQIAELAIAKARQEVL